MGSYSSTWEFPLPIAGLSHLFSLIYPLAILPPSLMAMVLDNAYYPVLEKTCHVGVFIVIRGCSSWSRRGRLSRYPKQLRVMCFLPIQGYRRHLGSPTLYRIGSMSRGYLHQHTTGRLPTQDAQDTLGSRSSTLSFPPHPSLTEAFIS